MPVAKKSKRQKIVVSNAFDDDLRCLVRHYIAVFFRGRRDRYGRPVSARDIYMDERIADVMDLELTDGITRLYSAIGVNYTTEELKKFERNQQLPEDIILLMKMLDECAKLGIPQCYAAGILCIWAEVCLGKTVDRTVMHEEREEEEEEEEEEERYERA